MKYMGSKKTLLENGLGKLILEVSNDKKRFIDLFSGTGSVAIHVAKNTNLEVVAVDLQKYSAIMSDVILSRVAPHDTSSIFDIWLPSVVKRLHKSKFWKQVIEIESSRAKDSDYVFATRNLCDTKSLIGPVWNAYGGYYFSALQSLTFDYMLKYLPENLEERKICHAAIISAASQCAAAPGHTAQPFNPKGNGLKYIFDSWKKDPVEYFKLGVEKIAQEHALVIGKGLSSNAEAYVDFITDKDVVFLDPPYSGVQYSRFYHVLEVIARNKHYEVSGIGRYPPINERPQSEFSNVGTSKGALERLLKKLSRTGATLIFTFPEKECSNGLSGSFIVEVASKWFNVRTLTSNSKFSTLGGNNIHRNARMHYDELVLVMTNKCSKNASQDTTQTNIRDLVNKDILKEVSSY